MERPGRYSRNPKPEEEEEGGGATSTSRWISPLILHLHSLGGLERGWEGGKGSPPSVMPVADVCDPCRVPPFLALVIRGECEAPGLPFLFQLWPFLFAHLTSLFFSWSYFFSSLMPLYPDPSLTTMYIPRVLLSVPLLHVSCVLFCPSISDLSLALPGNTVLCHPSLPPGPTSLADFPQLFQVLVFHIFPLCFSLSCAAITPSLSGLYLPPLQGVRVCSSSPTLFQTASVPGPQSQYLWVIWGSLGFEEGTGVVVCVLKNVRKVGKVDGVEG